MKRAKGLSISMEKKRKVMYVTFERWKHKFDKDCKTITWLDCESSVEVGTKVVRKLKCTVCMKFQSSILYKRNFSDNWIPYSAKLCWWKSLTKFDESSILESLMSKTLTN